MMRLVMAVLLMALANGVLACSCAFPEGTLEEKVRSSVESAAAVVLARAESISEAQLPSRFGRPESEGYPGEITHFSEIRSWKGSHGKQFYTRITTACCMCGRSFDEGDTYLLYLYGPDDEGFYSTSICSRTSAQSRVEEGELEVLERVAAEQSKKRE
ncbi:hypothetical protein [Microbulbifer halophilus]|uniref:Secreted protein n=1 Tax=Microbulbifer halophilus TaxID=453963 RepID=A0ABW5E9Y8_9GAMM|nr:hypothetical protein [Microbulbifer halophilus]MCW8127517.1 hypothetical protein [Microbulbifer halophilus]